MTRDSIVLLLAVVGSVLVYLGTAPPPTSWDYAEAIKFGSFIVGLVAAKLATSPLPGAPKE